MNFLTMPPHARVWVYQADRSFTETEQEELAVFFNEFVKQWTAHNKQLKATMDLLYGRFVVVMLDESFNAVSGCGIDKSVNFLKAIEGDFQVSFFNRLLVAYKNADAIEVCKQHEVTSLLAEGKLSADTLVFNNAVQTREEFDAFWLTPLKNTWLSKYLPQAV
jgi:hypothetical protein